MNTHDVPTLFLDFDGVLHPDEVYRIKGKPTLKGEGSLFMWESVLVDLMAEHRNIQIVLSTSWVRELGFHRARGYLSDRLRSKIIGGTWHSRMKHDREEFNRPNTTWWDQATRYQQIMRYVNRAQLSHWIAIDDQVKGWDDRYRDNLIQTQPYFGIGDKSVQQQIAMFLAKYQ